MSNELIQKKQKIETMQLEMNILKLETRLLEIEEEKVRIAENIEDQKNKLKDLKTGKNEEGE